MHVFAGTTSFHAARIFIFPVTKLQAEYSGNMIPSEMGGQPFGEAGHIISLTPSGLEKEFTGT